MDVKFLVRCSDFWWCDYFIKNYNVYRNKVNNYTVY